MSNRFGCGDAPEDYLIESDMGARPYDPFRPLDRIHPSLLSSWDSATSTTANTSREPQHASAILTLGRLAILRATSRDLPGPIATTM